MKQMVIAVLMISLLSVSCSKSGNPASEESVQSPAAPIIPETPPDDIVEDDVTVPPPVTSTLPKEALTFRSNITLYDFSGAQTEKYNEAIAIVKKVIATEEFRNRVLGYRYNGLTQFANNNGMTNAQIYQSLLDAAEKLTPVKNNSMDLGVKLYYENNSVVGWTNASIKYINVNTKFFSNYDYHEVAANLFHEWCHKLGYGHDSAVTAKRPYSVPYALGYLIRDIGADFL